MFGPWTLELLLACNPAGWALILVQSSVLLQDEASSASRLSKPPPHELCCHHYLFLALAGTITLSGVLSASLQAVYGQPEGSCDEFARVVESASINPDHQLTLSWGLIRSALHKKIRWSIIISIITIAMAVGSPFVATAGLDPRRRRLAGSNKQFQARVRPACSPVLVAPECRGASPK